MHLFCEILERLKAVGLANDHSGPLPLTHTELGLFNECLLSGSALWPRNDRLGRGADLNEVLA